MAQVENLYRLSINPAKQFDARNADDFGRRSRPDAPAGSAFVVETEEGITGFVFLGKGEMRFHPTPEIEKGQVKIFCGARCLSDALRRAPTFGSTRATSPRCWTSTRFVPRAVDARELRRADEVFREDVLKSYAVDMADMSRDLWSIMPAAGDFLAEIHTPRYDTLTYARSRAEPEDISFFDRKRHRNISVYSSKETRERCGRSYNEDDFVSYDVLGYDIDLAVSPDRHGSRAGRGFRSGSWPPRSTAFAPAGGRLTVQSIVSDHFGRLLGFRVRNQNTIIINLPAVLLRDDDLMLTIVYAGRLKPQRRRHRGCRAGRPPQGPAEDMPVFAAERSFLYSNRSYWYPQATVTDYATASLRITVAVEYRLRGERHAASRLPDSRWPVRMPVSRERCICSRQRSRCGIWRSSQPVHTSET